MDGTNSVLVSWENVIPILNAIDHYDVFVNEKQVGKVVARNKRLLITDTNLTEDTRDLLGSYFPSSESSSPFLRQFWHVKGG
uniref:Uncharacterized protein n=1 Tax=Meloidogyne incognita TaxID=6306 RepID=A0A914MA84_MELIC